MVEKDKLDWAYYFKSIPTWIRLQSKDMTEGFAVRLKDTRVRNHYTKIVDTGVEFYTCDDDDLDKEYGMYYGNLDFDPLEIMAFRSGHTKMFYKENGKWQLL